MTWLPTVEAQWSVRLGALKQLVSQVMPVGPIERMVDISQTLARVRQSDDMKEGIQAFKEKRKPTFRGR